VFPFRTASDSETTAPVLSLVSVLSIDRPELFITDFEMILNSTYAAAENISTRLPGLISVLTVKSLSAASSFLFTAFFLLRL
jgi:hypothetical protein